MLEWLRLLVDTSGFPARWYCGTGWTSLHGWTHIIADLAIWGAYFAIPVVLIYYVIKRPDVPFPRVFWLFGLFILSCGTIHIIEATIFWHPWYRLSALVKVATAAASWATVVALIPTIPRALALPGLAKTNDELKREVEERRRVEKSLRASDEWLNLALECAAMGSWSYDGHRDRIIADNRFGRLLGQSEGAVDWSFDELLARLLPHDRSRIRAEFVRCLAAPGELEMEWHVGNDRDRRTLRVRGTVYRSSNDEATISGVCWDITAQQKIAESDRMLATIVESTHDAILSVDLDGTIRSWNTGARLLYGYTADETLGCSITMLTADRSDDGLARLKQVAQGRHSGPLESLGRRKDGTMVDVSSTYSPVWGTTGKVVRASVVAQNISARKDAERAVLEGEARKAAILSSALDGIMTMDHEGKVVELNPAAEKMFGYTREQMIGRAATELIVPAHLQEQHRRGLNNYLATPESQILDKRVEMTAVNALGGEFPVEIAVTQVKVPGPPLFTAFIRDITERRRAEEQFRLAVESAPNSMIMVDREGIIILVNAQTERMFGYPRAELLGKSLDTLVPARFRDGHPKYRADFFSRLSVRSLGQERGLSGVRKDGSEFPIEIGLNPIETLRGTFVLSSIVDITERKAYEAELLKSNERLTAVNQELEQFVYTVSHDLKSPLVTIEGFSGHLLADLHAGRGERLGQFTVRIQDAARKMSHTIDALLEVSRVGRVVQPPEQVSIHSLVRGWITEHADQIEAAGAQFVVEEELPVISGDRLRLTQLFENLLSNALKYGCERPNGKVTIGASRWGKEVRIFVRDNGPGIPEAYQTKIFELFERLHQDEKGTGVGLNLAKRAAEVNGGRLWVESKVDEGTTFWVAFPMETITLESNF